MVNGKENAEPLKRRNAVEILNAPRTGVQDDKTGQGRATQSAPTPSPPLAGEVVRVVELLLSGQVRAAEVLLREWLASQDYLLAHSRSVQIRRVESYFREQSGKPPWPADFSSGDLIHWRGQLGGILSDVPLARLLDDLKGSARGRQNLLYYLSAEKGKRASRWEMLLCDYRVERWEAAKKQERADAEKFFEELPPLCPPTTRGGRPEPPLTPPLKQGGTEPEWVAVQRKWRGLYMALIEELENRKLKTENEEPPLAPPLDVEGKLREYRAVVAKIDEGLAAAGW